jgi:hypothetical protein
MAVSVGVLTRTQMMPGLYVYVVVIDLPIIIKPIMYQMRDGMGSTFLPDHTRRLITFFGELKLYPNPGSPTIIAM